MCADRFHDRPFDEGTLTKLRVFELYAGEWLPVFFASDRPIWTRVHLVDFFAGPGMDADGTLGSPLRLLRQLAAMRDLPGWPKVRVNAHFYDADASKVQSYAATKLTAFEDDLDKQLRAGALNSEADVMHLCFQHGVKRQHAEPVIARLTREGVISCGFRVPQVTRYTNPKPIRLLR
jgi:three-Cys-motif partner protein